MNTHSRRPLAISSGLSLLAGVLATVLVATEPGQRPAVGVALVGLVGVVVGLEARHRDYGLGGAVLTLGGVAVVLGGLGWGFVLTRDISPKVVLLPAIIGLLVLVLGLGSVRPGSERWFVSAGAGGILLAVFVSGLVHGASVVALLAATAATVVAWDLGEQAINMGEQVGRQAGTWNVEVAHGGVSVLVAGGAVLLALVISGVGVRGLPLAGMSILLGAGMVLAIAFYT